MGARHGHTRTDTDVFCADGHPPVSVRVRPCLAPNALLLHALLAPAVFFAAGGGGGSSPRAPAPAAAANTADGPDAAFDPVGIFVVDGNSHTQSRHGATAMPENVLRELGDPPHLAFFDRAHSGHGMVEMRVRAPEGVDPLFRPGKVNLLLYWEGVHDLYEGFSAEETFQRLREYGLDRQRTGFTVVTLSLLPAAETNTPPTYERDRQTVNALLRACWREFADAFVDVGADPELGDPEAPRQGVYYSPKDQVHLTEAGSLRIARQVADAVRPLLGR